MQLKQLMQRDASIVCAVKSIHSALHEVAQRPQWLQCGPSICKLNSENCEMRPSSEPTGHNVLQNNRPCHMVASVSENRITAEYRVASRLKFLKAIRGNVYRLIFSRSEAIPLFNRMIAGRANPVVMRPKLLYGSVMFRGSKNPAKAIIKTKINTA